jgi:hypothetical protein
MNVHPCWWSAISYDKSKAVALAELRRRGHDVPSWKPLGSEEQSLVKIEWALHSRTSIREGLCTVGLEILDVTGSHQFHFWLIDKAKRQFFSEPSIEGNRLGRSSRDRFPAGQSSTLFVRRDGSTAGEALKQGCSVRRPGRLAIPVIAGKAALGVLDFESGQKLFLPGQEKAAEKIAELLTERATRELVRLLDTERDEIIKSYFSPLGLTPEEAASSDPKARPAPPEGVRVTILRRYASWLRRAHALHPIQAVQGSTLAELLLEALSATPDDGSADPQAERELISVIEEVVREARPFVEGPLRGSGGDALKRMREFVAVLRDRQRSSA